MRKKLAVKSSLSVALGAIVLAGCQTTSAPEQQILPVKNLPLWNIGDIQQTYKVSSIADSGAGKGGAIYNTVRLHVINSTITKNSSTKSSGGLFNETGVAVVTNSTFSSNSAPAGVVVFNEGQLQQRNTILVKS